MNYKKQYLKYKQKYLMSQMGGSTSRIDAKAAEGAAAKTRRDQLLLFVDGLDYNTETFDISTFIEFQKKYVEVSSILADYSAEPSNKYKDTLNMLLTEVFRKLPGPLVIPPDPVGRGMYPKLPVSVDVKNMLTINIDKLNESFDKIKSELSSGTDFNTYNSLPNLAVNQDLLNGVGEIYRDTLFNIQVLLNSENVPVSENQESPEVTLKDVKKEVTLEDVKSFIQTKSIQFKNQPDTADDKEDYRLIELKNNDFITALCPGAGYVDGNSTYSHILVALIKTNIA